MNEEGEDGEQIQIHFTGLSGDLKKIFFLLILSFQLISCNICFIDIFFF